MDVRAGELDLHLLTAEEAQLILQNRPGPTEVWATDYPSVEQVDFLEAYVLEARSADRAHHWQSQLRRRSDGLVVGGAGVDGPPDAHGAVVVGYQLCGGLSDALHGRDIVLALVDVARDMGARSVTSNVFDDDLLRRQVYLDAGLTETRHEGRVLHLARDV
jgi:hypothetical protein